MDDMTNPSPITPVRSGASQRSRRSRARRSWGWLVALIVLVVVVGGGVGTYAVSNAVAEGRYAAETPGGDGVVGTLQIPRFGDSFQVPIVQSTSLAQLRRGIGWYDGTAAPGQIGNFALAGHRLGWGQPFAKLRTLRVGDEVVVTTGTGTFTYTIITGPTVVASTESDILAPVPGDPGRNPTKALITLTTAASWLPTPDRLVVVGELTSH